MSHIRTLSQLGPRARWKRGIHSLTPAKPAPTVLKVDLAARRTSQKVSVRQAATAAGVSPATISRTEIGATPSLDMALRTARFYELTVEQIWALREVEEEVEVDGAKP